MPWRCQHEERRSHHHEEDVLQHVHPEEVVGEAIDRTGQRDKDGCERANERCGAPAPQAAPA